MIRLASAATALVLAITGVACSNGKSDTKVAPSERRPIVAPSVARLDQLFGGSFHLVIRQTFLGSSNREQLAAAQEGHPTYPADGEVALWFSTDTRGNIVSLRSTTLSLPERRLWSETRYVSTSDETVLLRHHIACRDEHLTAPPPSLQGLLKDFGGPLPPFAAAGFTRVPSDPDVYTSIDGDMEWRLKVSDTLASRTYRAVDTTSGETVLLQTNMTLEPAAPSAVVRPLRAKECEL